MIIKCPVVSVITLTSSDYILCHNHHSWYYIKFFNWHHTMAQSDILIHILHLSFFLSYPNAFMTYALFFDFVKLYKCIINWREVKKGIDLMTALKFLLLWILDWPGWLPIWIFYNLTIVLLNWTHAGLETTNKHNA